MEALKLAGLSEAAQNAIQKLVLDQVLMCLNMKHQLAEHQVSQVSFPKVANPGIAKVFDEGQGIGTFTFVGSYVGFTAFHAVYLAGKQEIRESTLSLRGDGIILLGNSSEAHLQHIVSFPHHDMAVYKVIDGKAKCHFDVTASNVNFGDSIALISFPALQPEDCNLSIPVHTFGHVSQNKPSRYNNFLLGDYESFPQCSGGAVISTNGELMGMHVSSAYYGAGAYDLNNIPDYPSTCGAVHSLHWVPPEEDPQSDTDESIDLDAPSDGDEDVIDDEEDIVRGMSEFAIKHKGHLAVFLPVCVISVLLQNEGVLKGPPIKKRKVTSKSMAFKQGKVRREVKIKRS